MRPRAYPRCRLDVGNRSEPTFQKSGRVTIVMIEVARQLMAVYIEVSPAHIDSYLACCRLPFSLRFRRCRRIRLRFRLFAAGVWRTPSGTCLPCTPDGPSSAATIATWEARRSDVSLLDSGHIACTRTALPDSSCRKQGTPTCGRSPSVESTRGLKSPKPRRSTDEVRGPPF